MIKYLLFDFDGVLYDAKKLPMEQYLFQEALMFWKQKTGKSAHEIERLAELYWRKYGSSPIGFELHQNVPIASLARGIDYSLFQRNDNLRIALQKVSIPKVIFSNSNRFYLDAALQHLGIRDQFSHVFCVDSTKDSPKPNIKSFENVLQSLQASPKECLFFEDNATHLATAKRLGFHTVYCNHPQDISPDADYSICCLDTQLTTCVTSFNGNTNNKVEPIRKLVFLNDLKNKYYDMH